MEEQVTTGGIILNVVIQIANLAVFFFAFKYFLGDKITKALSEREQLIKKLKHADHEYQEILDKAKMFEEGFAYVERPPSLDDVSREIEYYIDIMEV